MSRVFDLVLGVFREPGLVTELREKELPENLSLVIRLAAGEGAALQCALDTTGETAETLVEACVFFLQQVLFAPGADSYRVLGADDDAPQDRLRDNYRWLMKWLHPDRNQDGWEAVYADRVNVAWQDLKTPDRRAEYDRRPRSTQMLAPATPAPMRRIGPVAPTPGGPLLSGSTVRRLPTLVLGALGLAAAAMIGITYWAQNATQRELSEHRRDRSAPTEPLAVRQYPESKTPDADAAATVGSVAAAAGGEIEAINVAYGVAALPSSVVTIPVREESISRDIPMIAARVPGSDIVHSIEPAASATVAKPDDMPAAVLPVAAVPIAEAPKSVALDKPPQVQLAATVPEQIAPDPPAAPAAPRASGSVVSAPTPTMVVSASRTPPEPDKPALASRSPDPVPAPVETASESARRPPEAPATSVAPPAAPPVDAVPSLAAATVEATEAFSAPSVAEVELPLPVPAQHDAEALVKEFASAYAAGDLARFDRLFTGASSGFAELIPMRSRFDSTEMRFLEIQQIGWHAEAEQGKVRARFRDTYVPRGGRKAVTESGVIEWTIRVDEGDARIASVARNNG